MSHARTMIGNLPESRSRRSRDVSIVDRDSVNRRVRRPRRFTHSINRRKGTVSAARGGERRGRERGATLKRLTRFRGGMVNVDRLLCESRRTLIRFIVNCFSQSLYPRFIRCKNKLARSLARKSAIRGSAVRHCALTKLPNRSECSRVGESCKMQSQIFASILNVKTSRTRYT